MKSARIKNATKLDTDNYHVYSVDKTHVRWQTRISRIVDREQAQTSCSISWTPPPPLLSTSIHKPNEVAEASIPAI